MENSDIIHLYNRVGFGILPQDLKTINDMSRKDHVQLLLKKSKKTVELKVDSSSLKQFDSIKDKVERRMKAQKENRKLLMQLNRSWYNQLYNSKTLLHDKMRLFWANHFVCSSNFLHFTEKYLKVIETYALGNFKDFVIAISKDPVMIRYLNNQQNKKEHPNENYARELMELFTLGVGHYTEEDIQESARAFTGWSSDRDGNFIFRKKFHDFGEKTFLGKTGNFDGNDIIDIILDQPQCALFICEMI